MVKLQLNWGKLHKLYRDWFCLTACSFSNPILSTPPAVRVATMGWNSRNCVCGAVWRQNFAAHRSLWDLKWRRRATRCAAVFYFAAPLFCTVRNHRHGVSSSEAAARRCLHWCRAGCRGSSRHRRRGRSRRRRRTRAYSRSEGCSFLRGCVLRWGTAALCVTSHATPRRCTQRARARGCRGWL